MAYEISDGGATPHATNYSDLLDKLITFLVATGVWNLHSDLRGTVGEVTLRGEGLAGTENIYVGIKRYVSVGSDIHGWVLQGYTGFTGAGFNLNPGAIDTYLPALPLWNGTIPYWFFANARRFIVVAKVDNVYMSMYAGHILPYGSPGHWFYPLCIGGSNVTPFNSLSHPRYSDITTAATVPFVLNSTTNVFDSTRSNLVVRGADGTWIRLFNNVTTIIPSGGSSPNDTMWVAHGIYPFVQRFAGVSGVTNDGQVGWSKCRPNQAGDYPLVPLRLLRSSTPDALGILDGAYYVPGYNLNAEDIIQYSGDDYICFQDVFRTNLDSNFAIKKA